LVNDWQFWFSRNPKVERHGSFGRRLDFIAKELRKCPELEKQQSLQQRQTHTNVLFVGNGK